MALISCPVCGKSISEKATECPKCANPILHEEISLKTTKYFENKKPIVAIILIVVIMCALWVFSDIQKKEDAISSYNYVGDNYVPLTGNEGALASAESYLNSSAFSYIGLIEQLEYEGFTLTEAKYGADNCGANWKKQALRTAESYLNSSSFSYSGLFEQLEYEGFTSDEAQYGVDNCIVDWNEQAVKTAKSYISSSSDWSMSELMDQLEYEGFTYSQAKYGVDNCGEF